MRTFSSNKEITQKLLEEAEKLQGDKVHQTTREVFGEYWLAGVDGKVTASLSNLHSWGRASEMNYRKAVANEIPIVLKDELNNLKGITEDYINERVFDKSIYKTFGDIETELSKQSFIENWFEVTEEIVLEHGFNLTTLIKSTLVPHPSKRNVRLLSDLIMMYGIQDTIKTLLRDTFLNTSRFIS